MDADRRREVVNATLEALRHTVGRDEHMPPLKRLVEGQIGPVTFAEIAAGLASVEVSGRDAEGRDEWPERIETVRRAARSLRQLAYLRELEIKLRLIHNALAPPASL